MKPRIYSRDDSYQSYICLVSLVFHIVWMDDHLEIDIESKKYDAYFDCFVNCARISPRICWSADLGEAVEGLLLIIIIFKTFRTKKLHMCGSW